jgi:soluble lytic murein transglycosylase-like protein
MLETALELGFDGRPEDLFVPRVGLSWGAKYLRRCLNITEDDYRRALARYNGAGQMAEAYATRVFTIADQQKALNA